jgi:hypothetical protein
VLPETGPKGGIMKSLIVASALVLGLIASPASAEEILKINNRTGYTISEIYIAPASVNNWEEDVMGDQTLETGTSVDIDFSRSADTCKWDLKAVYDDKTSAVWHNVNLCKISTISLFYNAETDVTTARYE